MSVDWLLSNAAPVVRYRTLTELACCDVNINEVLALPQTQKRLALLKNMDYTKTHGSPGLYLENVLPMLNDFGLYYGMDGFSSPIGIEEITAIVSASDYDKLIAYPFLLRSKFPICGLLDFTIERINTIHDFTRHMSFDIYDDTTKYKSVPESFRDRPIIKPEIDDSLPMIYDIVAMAAVYDHVSAETQAKIDNIIEYVTSPEYDIVVFMYGIICIAPGKYKAKGWDCKVSNSNIHRLLLYSTFPAARNSAWFQNAIDFFAQYKTARGTYIFPKEYLPEADSNWVLGARMSLAENRKKKSWLEIESTFYMLKMLG